MMLFTDGHDSGPLFAPLVKRRPARPKPRGWVAYYRLRAQRTPRWKKQWKIDLIYAIARLRGVEVDHDIPLNHPLVCGLHIETNLCVLHPDVNRRKGNRWCPDQLELL